MKLKSAPTTECICRLCVGCMQLMDIAPRASIKVIMRFMSFIINNKIY